MADRNVIRQDIVQIGFEVDQSSINRLDNSLEEAEGNARELGQAADDAAAEVSRIGTEAVAAARDTNRLRDNGFDDVENDAEEAAEAVRGYREEVERARRSEQETSEQTRNNSNQSTEGVEGLTSSVGDLTSAFAGVAAAFAANVIIQNANEVEQAMNKLESQTGATAEGMEVYSEAVKDMYASGRGGSITEVADAMALVNQQFKDLDSNVMESITNDAMILADTFDMDLNETLRGINGLMTNMGLTAEEAFDYIVKGAQNGLDKSHELSDNIAEYSQLWSQAGFSAEEMFTILQNGLDSGAYNLDKVNDFVKEFTISLSDGRVEENIESFSKKTQDLFYAWQNGEATSKEVFNSIITDLNSMTTEQEALTVASTVWSALGEDNAMKVITSLNNVNTTYGDVKGTMEEINEVRYDDINSSLERLQRSGQGLVNETLSPALTGLNNLLSEGIDWVTEFAEEHEVLASAITAGTLTVAALGTAMLVIPPVVNAASAAFAALNISMGPIAIAIGAVAAVVGITAAAFAAADDEIEEYDGTLQECREELELTTIAHKKAVERYGKESEAAKELEKEIEKLNSQYEKGGGAVAEYNERLEEIQKAYKDLSKAQDEVMDGFDNSATQGYQAISMLEALSSKANITSNDLDVMANYADYLNDTFHTNIVVDYDTGELTGFNPDDVVEQILSVVNSNKVTASMDYLTGTEFVEGYISAAQEYQQAQSDLLIAAQMIENKHYARTHEDMVELEGNYRDAEERVKETKETFEDFDSELEEHGRIIDDTGKTTDLFRQSLQDTAKSGDDFVAFADETSEATEGISESVQTTIDTMSDYNDSIDDLAQAYDEALAAAQESVQGQYKVWEEVGEIAEISVADVQSALESQATYWSEYTANLDILREKSQSITGLSDMLAEMTDGSEDSMAAVAALADATDSDLASVVENWQTVKGKQEEVSTSIADTQTQFSLKTDAMTEDILGFVNEMDQTELAELNASTTANSFIDTMKTTLQTRKFEVTSELQSIINLASSSSGTQTRPRATGHQEVDGYATGTTNSADVFIAGEEGAELYVGKQGGTVFPKSETDKIINAVQDYAGEYTPENSSTSKYVNNTTTYAPSFVLNMNGASATDTNKRKVQRWIKDSLNETFKNLSKSYLPTVEI